MTLIEALKSGKECGRPGLDLTFMIRENVLLRRVVATNSWYTDGLIWISLEDLLADNWEVAGEKVGFTIRELEDAYKFAKSNTKITDYDYEGRFIRSMIRKLGFKE